ncbi:MAG: hypothetical protein BWY45_03276 [Euryarchaeota archaeon ADurb.Bin294]|nr:MAG: hypothetical protein BWY45_03276 [Euryarchaeota archaeon ADurb.Bin294]
MITFSSSSLIGFHQNGYSLIISVFKVIYPALALSDLEDAIIDIDGKSPTHHHCNEIRSQITGLPSDALPSLGFETPDSRFTHY